MAAAASRTLGNGRSKPGIRPTDGSSILPSSTKFRVTTRKPRGDPARRRQTSTSTVSTTIALSPVTATLDAVAFPTAVTTRAAPSAPALKPCETAILSVLRLWPRGAAEAAVAHRASLDNATAAAALRRLRGAGFVVSSEETPPARRCHQRVVFWRLADAAATAALMAHVPRPDPAQRRGPQGPVPDEFWHHFCSGSDPADLRLPDDAALVVCRLIESFDSEARSWVLSSFTVEQLAACHSRYPDPSSEAPQLLAAAIEALS